MVVQSAIILLVLVIRSSLMQPLPNVEEDMMEDSNVKESLAHSLLQTKAEGKLMNKVNEMSFIRKRIHNRKKRSLGLMRTAMRALLSQAIEAMPMVC